MARPNQRVLTADALTEAWAKQAQVDAERGTIECRLCRRTCKPDEVLTLWRNGLLAFAVCDRCVSNADVVISGTVHGIEIQARRRGLTVLGRA